MTPHELIKELRGKTSRDNRELLDQAADTIERLLNAAEKKPLELKPCPFCGGQASITIDPEGIKDSQGRHWKYQVTCMSCCATTGIVWSIEKAAEAWNTRYEPRSRWVKKSPNDKLDGEYYCPECGETIDIATGEETPLDRGICHCPGCGTCMKEE